MITWVSIIIIIECYSLVGLHPRCFGIYLTFFGLILIPVLFHLKLTQESWQLGPIYNSLQVATIAICNNQREPLLSYITYLMFFFYILSFI